MNFRKLSPLEAPILAEMAKRIFVDSWERPWKEEEFRRLLLQPAIQGWLVFKEDNPQGFILSSIIGEEAEIFSLGILADFRRQGLGRALILHLVENASPDLRRIFLEVAQENHAASAFYGRLGFEICGKRPRYYDRASESAKEGTKHAPMDAIVMRASAATIVKQAAS